MRNSIFEEIDKIHCFVKGWLRDEHLAGFNVYASKHPGRCYILVKRTNSFKAVETHTCYLDYLDPFERSVICNAIHYAMHGVEMTPEAKEREMICRSSDYTSILTH